MTESPSTGTCKTWREKGFTLVESMIAVAVLSISLVGLAQLMAVALQQSSFARYNTMAVEVAQMKLEELRTEYNNELKTNIASSNLTAGSHPSGSPGYEPVILTAPTYSNIGDSQFQVSWTLAVSGKAKTVTVTVDPQVQNELTSKSLSISTVFSP